MNYVDIRVNITKYVIKIANDKRSYSVKKENIMNWGLKVDIRLPDQLSFLTFI